MNFFDQNSAPAISGNLANYTFRRVGALRTDLSEFQGQNFKVGGTLGAELVCFCIQGLAVFCKVKFCLLCVLIVIYLGYCFGNYVYLFLIYFSFLINILFGNL